jgi:hypothetical protein
MPQESDYHDCRDAVRRLDSERDGLQIQLRCERCRTDGYRPNDGQCGRRSDRSFGRNFRPRRSDHRAVTPNPNFSTADYSPDRSFIYNNVYYPTGMDFDVDGLLFVTAQNPGGYWNLWGNSPGNYSLWESVGSYNYPIEESGTLTVAASPELSTWVMLAVGFAGFGVIGRRRAARLAESLG